MIPKFSILCFSIFLFTSTFVFAQISIHTKDGLPILNKRALVNNCLNSLHKDRNDSVALAICDCQVSKLDRRFTTKQYRQHTSAGIVDVSALIHEDSSLQQQINDCYTNSGKTILMQAEGFEDEFISDCKKNIRANSKKKLDESRVAKFCQCQLQMVKTKKLTDADMATLSNPNSLLFFETMYTCGDPFKDKDESNSQWSETSAQDITGPLSDTVPVLNLDGMTYVKVKTGSLYQFWLFDTGASDLLINNSMEARLKEEGMITNDSYLGIGEYEMANGMIDTCRRYKINNVRFGKYLLNNIVIAVTDKGKRIIVGKALLNKFSHWSIDNQKACLVLSK